MSSIPVAERKRLPHAGPGDSFPLKPSLIRSAWDLAGRSKSGNPDSIRRKVIAFAKSKGLLGRLPASAIQWAKQHGLISGGMAKKARTIGILQQAYEMTEDVAMKAALRAYAEQHQLVDALPQEESVTIHKAVNIVSKFARIEKAFEVGADTVVEGWVSTEDIDGDKDVVPPECFLDSLDGYMARNAPLSSNHDKSGYPIGHMQNVALVRDGRIFKAAQHPSDPHAFEHFPGTGTGMFGRAVINNTDAGSQIRKGNMAGFSWIGNLTAYDPLPSGGKRYVTVNPLLENTLAAYPVNDKAVMVAVKAYEQELGASQDANTPGTQEDNADMNELETILAEAQAAIDAEEAEEQSQGVSKADLGKALMQFEQGLLGKVAEEVKKALPAPAAEREDGAGRAGTVEQGDPFENDPASFIVAKARKGEDFTPQEQRIAFEMMKTWLTKGMEA